MKCILCSKELPEYHAKNKKYCRECRLKKENKRVAEWRIKNKKWGNNMDEKMKAIRQARKVGLGLARKGWSMENITNELHIGFPLILNANECENIAVKSIEVSQEEAV